VVAPEDLEVGTADAGQMDAYENLAGAGFGPGYFLNCRLSVKVEGKHKSNQPSAKTRLVKVIVRFSGSAWKSYREIGGTGVSPVHG
jgi:hypothetical protein